MKASVKNNLSIFGAVLAILGVLAFVGCLTASFLVWTPGTPSVAAQTLVIIAACGLPVSMLGMFIATLD